MPLFKGRSSLLEVQNQGLIKTAKERAARIEEFERELQIAASQIGQLQRELQTAVRSSGGGSVPDRHPCGRATDRLRGSRRKLSREH